MRLIVVLACIAITLSITNCLGAEGKPLTPTPTFKWKDWNLELGPDGNIQHLFISYDENEELKVLMRLGKEDEERRRKEHGIEPNEWKVVYCLSKETDMIYRALDGTLYRETGGMGRGDLEWALLNEQQYYDAAYGYSRGNLKITATDRIMEEPLLGEYGDVTFFWPRDWADLGIGLDSHNYDSIIGHYYPGPTRPWARGGTGGGGAWCDGMGHTSVQFAPGREVGGPLGDLGKITLHEWLHQIDGQKGWKCGYIGLPGQYAPGNYHHGSHLFWMRYMLPPRMWQTMRMQAPLMSPPNKPQDRYNGFIQNWLLLGEFDLPAEMKSSEAGIPHPSALDNDSIEVKMTMPSKDAEEGGKKWQLFTAESNQNNLPMRRVFLSPHKDAYAYAHTYIFSPSQRDAILWIGSSEPFSAYLNGQQVLKCWRGSAEDEASRNVVLMKGWNRLLVKKLDQEDNSWILFARFTDTKHITFEDLNTSGDKPAAEIVTNESAGALPPLEVKYYKWEYPYDNDWFGSLPIIHEEHLEKILGVKGVRILGAPGTLNGRGLDWTEMRYTLVDVSAVDKPEKILSRVVPWNSEKITFESDTTLNNVLNMSRETGGGRGYESMAIIRYKKDDGSIGDLVFVRADMIEPFMDIAKMPEGKSDWKHSERILGFICRDSKTFIVFDTNLGKQTPINELDMLVSKDQNIIVTAAPSIPRVLRGQECSVDFSITNTGSQEISPVLVIKEFAGDKPPVEANLGVVKSGASINYSMPVDTKRPAGLVNFIGTVKYKIGDKEFAVDKPVPINLFDAVTIAPRIDGPEIIMVPKQKFIVKVSNNLTEPISGTLKPKLPKGYSAKPGSQKFDLAKLDETKTFNFDVTVSDKAADGLTYLIFEAVIGKKGTLTSAGILPVSKSFAKDLVSVDFEEGITGDFGVTNAHYFVKISKNGPKSGKQCLEVFDRGGARYGHVAGFGHLAHHPRVPYLPDTQYVYDTKVYPYIDFWFKTDAKNDNLGLHIVLDDGENGYGFLLNGLWVQQWVPRIMVGKVDFTANGEWQHIVVNVDDALDNVLGETSHFVREVLIGDTRTFASGWWYYFDSHRHYIDDFKITKGSAPTATAHILKTQSGLKMYDRMNRVPAFDSSVVNGGKATFRLSKLDYFPWERVDLSMWFTNMSDKTQSVAIWPPNKIWEVNITSEDGKSVTNGWVSGYWREDQKSKDIASKTEHFRDLKPGESYSQNIPIQDLFGNWATENKVELERGKNYIVQVRYNSQATGSEIGLNAWTGIAESNTVPLKLVVMPTMEEELAALRTSIDSVRKAKACAQLGKGKHEPAIADLCKAAVEDENGDVRLNAVWALGEFGRFDMTKPEESSQKFKPIVETLVKALDDKNWRVGEYAAMSLGRIGDRSATPSLLKRLDNPSKWMRRRTADALYDMNDPASIDKLGELMKDKSREVREQVQRALNRFVGETAQILEQTNNAVKNIPENDQNRAEERTKLAEKAAALKPEFDKLFALANVAKDDEYWEIRQRWISELPKFRNLADVKPLIIAALNDKNERLREAAIGAIGAFGKDGNDATQRVVELLGDYYDGVRKAAVETLPKINEGKGVLELTGKDNTYWLRKYPRPGDNRYLPQ